MLHALNKRLFKPADRVGVAVSGGADSVALLRALVELRAELGIVLSVVHFNHKLRGEESEQDERFVAELAAKFDLPFHRGEAETRNFAREEALSIEAAARELRYAFFGKLLKNGLFDKIATAHTLDDQAETVLLRVFRGTGTSGLAGILPTLKVGEGAVIRPLLSTKRTEIVQYLRELDQPWREDISNSDTAFTRNRLRHELLPQIERDFNPNVIDALANLAEIARGEDKFWASATADAFVRCYRGNALLVSELLKLHKALQRRVLRLAAIQKGATLDFAHTERILDLLTTTQSREKKTIEVPGGFVARIADDVLAFHSEVPQPKPCGFSYSLPVPGDVAIPELGIRIRTSLVTEVTDSKGNEGYNDDHRLAIGQITPPLLLRNWRPGDRFWPAHSRSEKKVKELLQDRRVPSREKSLWPVALSGNEIVWMRGFPVSARHLAKANEVAVILEDFPL